MNRFSIEHVADSVTLQAIADVTVAISTRERPDALRRCLRALLEGSVLPREIVIVDQSRDERTRLLVESYRKSATPLRWFRHHGSGLGVSQNLALSNASSSVVAVIDDDCVAAPDWMEVIAHEFGVRDSIDVLTGRVLPLEPVPPRVYPVSSRTSETRVEFSRDAMPWDIGSGNNFVVKVGWWNRVGGNDERLGPGSPGQGGVDMDVFYRLLRAGARIRYEPNLVVYHERTTREGRIARRSMYGHGMGAACMIHFRRGDWNALRMFGRWLLMRTGRMWSAVRRRDGLGMYEEFLVLKGTARGVFYGLGVSNPWESVCVPWVREVRA